MTVYAVIPVHNRLAMTKRMLDCLAAQDAVERVKAVIVDDGSTDGTREFLAVRSDVTLLSGNGSLWWGGAVDLALRHILLAAGRDDWVLLLNNDTEIKPDFVRSLLDIASQFPRSVIGSIVRDRTNDEVLSVGPVIDAYRLRVQDWLDLKAITGASKDAEVLRVDALSGRGLLIPVAAIQAAGGMRPRWLPHYLADYELSLRFKAKGWQLLVAMNVPVYSEDDFGTSYRASSVWRKYTEVRSPSYLPAVLSFWWQASSLTQRFTFPIRLVFCVFQFNCLRVWWRIVTSEDE